MRGPGAAGLLRRCCPDHIRPRPSRPAPRAARQVIAPLLRILEKMHSLKLLHRDIKPENIFLTALGKFKLVGGGGSGAEVARVAHSHVKGPFA